MEETQEAVETTVEPTTETESAPVETNTDETPQESVATTEQPEKEVSKTVPYDRFHEINEAKKALEQENAYLKSLREQPQVEAAELDDAARLAVRKEALNLLAEQRMAEFHSRHGAELEKNELLAIAVDREMRKQQQQGKMINPDDAYVSAKKTLDSLIAPAQQVAKEEGLKEGQDIAKTKQQLAAVGETGKTEKVDPGDLSAEEFAKMMNIPRV